MNVDRVHMKMFKNYLSADYQYTGCIEK